MSLGKKSVGIIVAVLVAAGALALYRAGSERADHGAFPAHAEAFYRRAVFVSAGTYETGSREPGCRPPATFTTAGFYIWPVETPQSWWHMFRGEPYTSEQARAMPASSMTHGEASAFCEWFSGKLGVRARLPTPEEWEIAARAGTPGIPYPWGWGAPRGRAVYDVAAAMPVGTLKPNPWGIYDAAGNVAEWADDGSTNRVAPVMGGSWAERDARYLRISHQLLLSKNYRDADAGFRIVVDARATD